MEAQKNKVVQSLAKKHTDKYKLAQKYYSLLSALNNLKLTEREIQLIAYTAIKGTITYANARTEFCEMYNTTTATINNIVSKLKKVGIFIKEDGKVKVNPVIVLDFEKHINLFIQLQHEEDRQDSNDTEGSYSEEDGSGDGSV
jgi:DNA-binding MarR family transcriptional regulator|tara:strand:- start:124 stop:552 length:429 start_codon:yes stop_codon:yes gene_type:complete